LAKKTKKAPKAQDQRKKRTREHVIADQSLGHIQQFVANSGFTSEAVNKDYGYDVSVNTFDESCSRSLTLRPKEHRSRR
jgi:hypothetical protein